jgi:hypothetical protein
VIEGLEDTEDYRAFEASVISDYRLTGLGIASIVMDDCLENDRAKRGHSLRESRRNASAMKR